jgi:hypothetical protein
VPTNDHVLETMVRCDDPRADGCDRYHPAQFQMPFSRNSGVTVLRNCDGSLSLVASMVSADALAAYDQIGVDLVGQGGFEPPTT